MVVLAIVMALTLALGATSAGAQPMWGGPWYHVRYGDTLTGIAAMYGTSYWEIARANGIWNPNLIYAGQSLFIPPYMPGPYPGMGGGYPGMGGGYPGMYPGMGGGGYPGMGGGYPGMYPGYGGGYGGGYASWSSSGSMSWGSYPQYPYWGGWGGGYYPYQQQYQMPYGGNGGGGWGASPMGVSF
jgi:LysM repeat protein